MTIEDEIKKNYGIEGHRIMTARICDLTEDEFDLQKAIMKLEGCPVTVIGKRTL